MNKNCIIYGGAGFIGSHIAGELAGKGFRVTIFDKKYISLKNIEYIADKIRFIGGDFNNEKDIASSIRNNDYVIHLVSSTLPADSNLNPYYDVETNLKSSLHLFEECVKNKIKKVIFISSGGTVYGEPQYLPIREDHPTNPITSYGIIKLTIEKYLGLFKSIKGLDFRVLRFSNPFGERQNPKQQQGLIANFLYKIKHNKPIEIWGNGSVTRDYFYIADGAKAIYPAIKDSSGASTYNISSGKGLSINQLLRKFREILNIDFEVIYKPSRNFDLTRNVLDNSLAYKNLKWKPETKFSTALKNTWRFINELE